MADKNLTGIEKGGKLTTKDFRTIKVWTTTWRKTRMLAALTDMSMVAILDELVERELECQKRYEMGDIVGLVENL